MVTSFLYDSCTDIYGNIGFIQKNGLWGIVQKIGVPYTINSLSLVSTSGGPLNDVPNNTSFIVDVALNKVQERNEKDYVFVAVYGTDGTLLNLDYVKAQFAVNSKCSFGFNVPPQEKEIGQVKAYIRHDFNSMEPLAEIKSLEFSKN